MTPEQKSIFRESIYPMDMRLLHMLSINSTNKVQIIATARYLAAEQPAGKR